MSRPIPPYLRIHTEDLPAAPPRQSEALGELTQLCHDYELATGWALHYLPGDLPTGLDRVWSAPVDPGVGAALGHLAIEPPASGEPREPASLAAAAKLGGSLATLWGRLLRTEKALWHREAELAAGVPVVGAPSERHLAERLEAALAGGARALDCQAAALYLLDSDTTALKARSLWGLSKRRLLDPPRKLATALADLEALLGHAVVLSDTRLYERWNPPEEFASAVCVPVSSPSTPLGTLWFFSSLARDFDERQTEIAELTAARIAADLEREMLLHTVRGQSGDRHQLHDATAWQRRRLPTVAPLVEGWQVSGWHRGGDDLAAEFYDWWMLPCGTLAVAIGDSLQRGLIGGLSAASLREQVRSCALFLSRPDSLLERISQLLWTSSAGDQFAGLGVARLTNDAGRVELAAGGPLTALHLAHDGCRSLGESATALGHEPDQLYQAHSARLAPGEAIVLASDGLIEAANASGRPLGAAGLAEILRRHQACSAQALADVVRTRVEAQVPLPTTDQTLLVLKRR